MQDIQKNKYIIILLLLAYFPLKAQNMPVQKKTGNLDTMLTSIFIDIIKQNIKLKEDSLWYCYVEFKVNTATSHYNSIAGEINTFAHSKKNKKLINDPYHWANLLQNKLDAHLGKGVFQVRKKLPKSRFERMRCMDNRRSWIEIHAPILGWEAFLQYEAKNHADQYVYIPIVLVNASDGLVLDYTYKLYKIHLWKVYNEGNELFYCYKIENIEEWE